MILASLVIGRSGFSSFQVLGDAWQDAEVRSVDLVRSDITITSITDTGPFVDVTVQNDGATAVVDFSRMDVVIQYTSAGTTYNKSTTALSTGTTYFVKVVTPVGVEDTKFFTL